MLVKNVYILYPAGYSGSFVDYAIKISDSDEAATIKTDPFSYTSSLKFGGVGTSHNYRRSAAHQSLDEFIVWRLANFTKDKGIFLINSRNFGTIEDKVSQILQFDKDGIIINIHGENDRLKEHYGVINSITKWPTSCAIVTKLEEFVNVAPEFVGVDPFDLSPSNFALRNGLVCYRDILGVGQRLNRSLIESSTSYAKEWYNIRNRYQPHEINETNYPIGRTDFSVSDRIFELSLVDIISDEFIPFLKNVISTTGVVTSPSFSLLAKQHRTYVSLQKNIQWFSSIRNWMQTGVLDDFLSSSSPAAAGVIQCIFMRSGIDFVTYGDRIRFNLAWRQFLTDNVTAFPGFRLGFTEILGTTVIPEILKLAKNKQWKKMSLEDINEVYQSNKF